MRSVLEQFKHTIAEHGEWTAVVDQNGDSTTYTQLNDISSRVATWLKERGIGREQLVAINMPRSMAYIAVELAVIKLGAAYMPLDAARPQEYVETSMRECGCTMLVTTWEYEQALACEPLPQDEWVEADPHDLAFVCYSSGSTGNPKAAAQEYGAYEPIIAAEAEDMHPFMQRPDGSYGPINRSLPSSFIFISSVMVIMSSLWLECPLYLPPDDMCRDTNKLAAYFAHNDIHFVYLTPPTIKKLLSWEGELPLTVVHTGAEVTSELYTDRFTILNCYSMSELAYIVLGFRIDRPYQVTPAGYPKVGADLILIDEAGVPNDKEGVLCAYVPYFRGYVGRSEKTHASCININNKHYFITNDLAYIDDAGRFVVRGRKDDAVKIGDRLIELSEVEGAVMQLMPNLGQVATRGYTDSNGVNYFCCYYTANHLVPRSEFRTCLVGNIDPDLLPRLFIRVDSFPLTPSGKINRRLLRVPLADDFLVGGI